jgi:AhpD family alkylhydroperoxidase
MLEKQSRVFHIREQIKNIHHGAKGFVLLKSSKKKRIINKKFKEEIMLAITEVNGCSMCSFVHTKLALSSGMSSKDIKNILDGNTSDIPIEDAVAVLFAQNFAYTKEQVSVEGLRRIIEEYGHEKSELILAACNMITMTNGMGTSMDHFYRRLRFKRNKQSYIMSELLNPLLTMLLFPPLVIYFAIYRLFTRISFINKKKVLPIG